MYLYHCFSHVSLIKFAINSLREINEFTRYITIIQNLSLSTLI